VSPDAPPAGGSLSFWSFVGGLAAGMACSVEFAAFGSSGSVAACSGDELGLVELGEIAVPESTKSPSRCIGCVSRRSLGGGSGAGG
jgi:hypothetical protein